MRGARTAAVGLAVAGALAGVAACGGGPGYKKTGTTATLPGMTGRTLAAARSAANSAGFHNVQVSDATGAKRSTADATAWRVCFQKPGSGTSSDTGVPVRLSVARSYEPCPAEDASGTSSPHPTRTHRTTIHHYYGGSGSGSSDDSTTTHHTTTHHSTTHHSTSHHSSSHHH
jgi:beta-lactam-binding protein with PASTA domain